MGNTGIIPRIARGEKRPVGEKRLEKCAGAGYTIEACFCLEVTDDSKEDVPCSEMGGR